MDTPHVLHYHILIFKLKLHLEQIIKLFSYDFIFNYLEDMLKLLKFYKLIVQFNLVINYLIKSFLLFLL